MILSDYTFSPERFTSGPGPYPATAYRAARRNAARPIYRRSNARRIDPEANRVFLEEARLLKALLAMKAAELMRREVAALTAMKLRDPLSP